MAFQDLVSDAQSRDLSPSVSSIMPVDNSSASGYLSQISNVPLGDTYRGIGSSWFNQGSIAKEDWVRDEQSAQNAWLRDMAQLDFSNQFNASEAQKQRDFEERMSNTAYQRAVEDMKKSGINPILAYSQGGSSTPSGASASSASSGGRSAASKARTYQDGLSGLIGAAAKLIGVILAGKIGAAAKIGSSLVSSTRDVYHHY